MRRLIQLVGRMTDMVDQATSVQKQIPSTVKRAVSALGPDRLTSPSVNPSPSGPLVVCPHPLTLNKLRAFMKNPKAEFTCPEQAQALDAVLSRSRHVFLIGPTGMGKTSVFLIPALECPHKVTIVLVPLSALRIDFARRCFKLGIQWSEWTESRRAETTIVMVSPENATKQSFLEWSINLWLRGLLLRFILDEAHFFKTHQGFRECFLSHRRLIASSECLSVPPRFAELSHALSLSPKGFPSS